MDAILRADASRIDALLLLAESHRMCDRRYAEIAILNRFLAVTPDDVASILRLADAYSEVGFIDKVVETIQQIDWATVDDPNALFEAASILRRVKQYDLALPLCERSAELDSDNHSAIFEIAMCHLSQREYSEGWRYFDSRLELIDDFKPPSSIDCWNGQWFSGKRLIVLSEGGFGDSIWASRFFPAVKRLGGQVAVQIPTQLRSLFDGIEGVDEFVDPEDSVDEYDYYAPLLSLPRILGTIEPSHFPPTPFTVTTARPELLGPVHTHGKDQFRVGIVWSGNPRYRNNLHRSAALTDFLPLLAQPKTQFFSLQKGWQMDALADSGIGDLVVQTDDNDLSEAAAVIEHLDLIIMTDSAVAHLAASLGKPVWVLVDHCPYWYFAGETSESAWYPTMRLFRQQHRNDWTSVIREIRAALNVAVQHWSESKH